MEFEQLIKKTEIYVKQVLAENHAGHDYWHIERVRKMSLRLAESHDADKEIVELAALLHDIADYKFTNTDKEIGGETAKKWLQSNEYDEVKSEMISQIIDGLSFKGANVNTAMNFIEGKIVQDADRLDAIGAIGIARAFAYGGSKSRPLYDPNIAPISHSSFEEYKKNTSPTINHFYEKLLLLKDLMNTDEAKKIARNRHNVMEQFLQNFYSEWEAKDY